MYMYFVLLLCIKFSFKVFKYWDKIAINIILKMNSIIVDMVSSLKLQLFN